MKRGIAVTIVVALFGCGDGSGGGTAATPTATTTPSATPDADGGRVFAMGSGPSVVRSENGGQSFARVADIDALGSQLFALTFVDELRGWAIGNRFRELPTILHTSDGGESWVSQTENIVVEDQTVWRLGDLAFSSAERGVAVGVVQEDLHLSARPVILSTVDGGAEWRSVLTLGRAAVLRSVCLNADGSGLAIGASAVSGSAVVRTDDGGMTWRDITAEVGLFLGADLKAVSCTETGQFSVGGNRLRFPTPVLPVPRGTLLFSPDDGGTWEDRTPPSLRNTSDSVVSLDFTDGRNGWALADGHMVVFHTEDAGVTWIEQALPDDVPGRVRELDFRDAHRGVVVGSTVPEDGSGSRPLVFTTADGGDTWARGTVPDDVLGLRDVVFLPAAPGS